MSTNRSLNKLEFKAHMSIHNIVPVSEEETHESSSYTRDRFQKKHRIADEDGSSRLCRVRKSLALLVMALFLATPLQAAGPSSVNMTVESEDLGEEDFNSRLGVHADEDKFGIPVNSSTSLGFNEDGDPNLSMRY